MSCTEIKKKKKKDTKAQIKDYYGSGPASSHPMMSNLTARNTCFPSSEVGTSEVVQK